MESLEKDWNNNEQNGRITKSWERLIGQTNLLDKQDSLERDWCNKNLLNKQHSLKKDWNNIGFEGGNWGGQKRTRFDQVGGQTTWRVRAGKDAESWFLWTGEFNRVRLRVSGWWDEAWNAKQLKGGREIRPYSGTQRFGAWKASGLDQSDSMGTHLDINLKRLWFLKGWCTSLQIHVEEPKE